MTTSTDIVNQALFLTGNNESPASVTVGNLYDGSAAAKVSAVQAVVWS